MTLHLCPTTYNHETQKGLALPAAATLATLETGVPELELIAVVLAEVIVTLLPAEVEFAPPAPAPVAAPDTVDPVDVEFDDTLELPAPVGLVQFSVKNT